MVNVNYRVLFWVWDVGYDWVTGQKVVNAWIGMLNWWEKSVFFRQLSPRPKLPMNCFIVSVDCELCLLPVIFDMSSDGSINVLKSPPIMTGQFEKF